MLDGASREIGCSECVELLADYIDGTLPRDQTELLVWHLDGCQPCVAFGDMTHLFEDRPFPPCELARIAHPQDVEHLVEHPEPAPHR